MFKKIKKYILKSLEKQIEDFSVNFNEKNEKLQENGHKQRKPKAMKKPNKFKI